MCLLDEAIDRIRSWLMDNATEASEAQLLEQLRIEQTCASLRSSYRPVIFLGAVFTENAIKESQVAKHRSILKAMAATVQQQRHVIAAFEWFCGVRFPTLTKLFPVLLKHLFDEDVVEEEAFMKWYAGLTRNEYSVDHSLISLDTLEVLKANAQPFIKWLQEADEDDEDEDEEEGEDDD